MDTKQQREAAFHDTAFSEATRERVWGYYSITGRSRDALREQLIAAQPAGKQVLEFGSGATAQAFFLADHGAQVTGIDISPVAVEQGRERAVAEGRAGQLDFRVMDAESLEFDDASFDLVCGSAVLHHLELARAYAELARVLKPGGAAFFVEPMGHNPLINAYRRRTPSLRTEDEHPLLMSDLEAARAHFGTVEQRFFNLTSLAAIPFRNRRGFERLLGGLDALDRRLFELVPAVQRHAWMVVLRLANPIDARTPAA